jgi:hypothetical protein
LIDNFTNKQKTVSLYTLQILCCRPTWRLWSGVLHRTKWRLHIDCDVTDRFQARRPLVVGLVAFSSRHVFWSVLNYAQFLSRFFFLPRSKSNADSEVFQTFLYLSVELFPRLSKKTFQNLFLLIL